MLYQYNPLISDNNWHLAFGISEEKNYQLMTNSQLFVVELLYSPNTERLFFNNLRTGVLQNWNCQYKLEKREMVNSCLRNG